MPQRFSWILPQELAVGSFPDATSSVGKLRRMNITAVLCLNQETESSVPAEVYHQFLWERVAIPDGNTGGIPDLAHFAQALEILTRWRNKGHTVYVHCLAGVGRSPSVCAAYLVHQHNMPLDEAIQFVKDRHSFAAPDQHQVRVMKQFFSTVNSEIPTVN
ncbi:MAG: dual specificity protein phosphatase family protein [Aphanocapsa sp. GSE-SYN-MK-11-07L]|jgi:protein-tyrosine phosphatase|nr:dual specificity protein phosphatase family protein [Aphanocapsa sp. GSE-SYN-MK-11-07L]